MGSFGMDWNQKSTVLWDWENLPPVGANAYANGNLKNVLQAETKLTGAVSTMRHESAQSSGGTFSSSSEMGFGSSKSSLSASIDSSSKVGNKKEFKFATVKEPDKNISKDSGFGKVDDTGNSPPLGVAVSRGEPVIGLKLGKRTYFEDVCGGQSVKNSPSGASAVATSTASAKKAKVAQQNTQNSYCQVEGCKLDLLSAKDYHRKHRVCEAHSKTPKVIVAGLERRFCQQCSRFHSLSEFDQNKRSCRRRLNDHNARRRKPQPEAFSSSRLSTMFYDARQQTSLLFGQGSYGQMRSCASSSWDNPGGFKFTETKASWLKPTRPLGVGEMHLSSQQVSNNILPHGEHHDFDGLMTFKGTNVKALNQGAEASAAVATNSNGAPDLQRALSLLSNSSVAAANLQPSAQLHPGDTTMAGTSNPVMDSSPGLWQGSPPLDQQAKFQVFHRLGATGHELRLPKPPSYDSSTHYGQMHH